MNSNRSLKLVKFAALGLLAGCLGASLSSAQAAAVKGEFNLPFEAHWGQAVLPAGDYTFTMDSASAPFTIFVRGEGQACMIMATAGHDLTSSSRSALLAVRHGATGTIRSLTLKDLGLVIYYRAPKGEPQTFAQAPELIQRVPVLLAQK